MRIRKHHLMMFDTCPKKLEYFAFQRLPRFESPQLAKGKIFHQTVEDFYETINPTVLLGNDGKGGLASQPHVAEYFRSLLPNEPAMANLFDNFAQFEARRWMTVRKYAKEDPMGHFKPVEQELELTVDLEEPIITSLLDEPIEGFGGRCDRIDWLLSGEYALGDIKTGPLPPSTKMRKELAYYVWLFEKAFAEKRTPPTITKPPRYIYMYSPLDNKYQFEELKTQTRVAMMRLINKYLDAVNTRNFLKVFGLHCAWCDFNNPCLWEEDAETFRKYSEVFEETIGGRYE